MTGGSGFRTVVPMDNLPTVIIALLILGYVLWNQTKGRPVVLRRLVVLPAVLIIWGLTNAKHAPASTGAVDAGLVFLDVVLSLALGAWRASTVQLSERNGFLYQQGRWSTIALWALSIATRVALVGVGHAEHAHLATSDVLLPVMFGLSIAAQSAVVAWRGSRTGVPFAPRSFGAGPSDPRTGSGRRAGMQAVDVREDRVRDAWW